MNTTYTVKEELTSIQEAAKELDKLMKDYDPYGYSDADYNIDQAFQDIDNDPGFVIMELVRMIRDMME